MREEMRKRGSPSLTVPTPLPRRSLAVALQRPSASKVTPAKASLAI
jgi:hypothetical protein